MCDEPSAIRRVTRRARKEHRCCEGAHRIAPGELYSYVSGVWDGRGNSFKQCLTCAALFEALGDAAQWDCGPCFEGLEEYVMEELR